MHIIISIGASFIHIAFGPYTFNDEEKTWYSIKRAICLSQLYKAELMLQHVNQSITYMYKQDN